MAGNGNGNGNNDAVKQALEAAPSEEVRRASFEAEEQRQLQEELDQAIAEQERRKSSMRVSSKGLPKEGWETSLRDSETESEIEEQERESAYRIAKQQQLKARKEAFKKSRQVSSKGLPAGGWEGDLLQDELAAGTLEQEKRKVQEGREKHPYATLLGDFISNREKRVKAEDERRKREDAALDDPNALTNMGILGYAVGKTKRAVKQSAEFHWEQSKKDFFSAPKPARKPAQKFPSNLLFNLNPAPARQQARRTKKGSKMIQPQPQRDMLDFNFDNLLGPAPTKRRGRGGMFGGLF